MIDAVQRLADGRVLIKRYDQPMSHSLGPGAAYLEDDDPSKLAVIATRDITPRWGSLLHVSLSYADRLPDWETVKLVKDAFFGDAEVMMVLPKQRDYVNEHQFTLHLWKMPEKWGLK